MPTEQRKRRNIADILVPTLNHLRKATLECVDQISQWQRRFVSSGLRRGECLWGCHPCSRLLLCQVKPRGFIWKGINYTLAMPSCLDHLDRISPLVERLGFHTTRNPLLIPSQPPVMITADGRIFRPQLRHVGGLDLLIVKEMERVCWCCGVLVLLSCCCSPPCPHWLPPPPHPLPPHR